MHFFSKRLRWVVLSVWVFAATTSVALGRDDSQQEVQIAERMLLYQRHNGGWPKNYERTGNLSREDRNALLSSKDLEDTTFDNGATYREMKHLAKVFGETGDDRFRHAFIRGLDFTLAAQYENGGWPQFYPRASGYHAHITFNDDAMIGVLCLLKSIARGEQVYSFVDDGRRARCSKAVEAGTQCILKCQIEVNGRRTAWCAQHDSISLAPQKARSYELPSISGSESVRIVSYLMDIDEPSPEVIQAVQDAIAWFDEAKLTGFRVERREDKLTANGYDKTIIHDPLAPPMWARFYEIGSNKPIFCSRDGVAKETLAEISYERRNGYSWFSNRAAGLLAAEYPAWQAKWAPGDNVLRTRQ